MRCCTWPLKDRARLRGRDTVVECRNDDGNYQPGQVVDALAIVAQQSPLHRPHRADGHVFRRYRERMTRLPLQCLPIGSPTQTGTPLR